jgi:predicted NBD/HSP70 family sugar kinase
LQMLRLGLDIGGTKIEGLHTRLLPARHGDSSGVRGAAWLPAMRPATPATISSSPREGALL